MVLQRQRGAFLNRELAAAGWLGCVLVAVVMRATMTTTFAEKDRPKQHQRRDQGHRAEDNKRITGTGARYLPGGIHSLGRLVGQHD